MIDKTKKYTYKGLPAEIISTNLVGDPVAAMITFIQGKDIRRFSATGHSEAGCLREFKDKRKCWLAVSFNGVSRTGHTRQEAISNLEACFIKPLIFACIEVEVEEGQGL